MLLLACGGGQRFLDREGNPGDWEATIARVASQLGQNLRIEGSRRLKVAVVDLTTPEGGRCSLGSAIAEELTTHLFRSGRFDVVERRQLQRLLAEQQMSVSDLLDPSSAARIGRVLGAAGIVTGTLTPTELGYRINARVILVESAAVVSVADADLGRDSGIGIQGCYPAAVPEPSVALAVQRQPLSDAPPPQPPIPVPPPAPSDGDASFVEDFSNVEDGRAPVGWGGTEHLMVQTRDRRRCLQPFEDSQGPYQVVIPVGEMGTFWSLEIELYFAEDSDQRLEIASGTLQVTYRPWFGRGALLDTVFTTRGTHGPHFLLLGLARREDLLRLSLQGAQVALARRSELRTEDRLVVRFTRPNGLTREFFRICKVSLSR